MPGWSLLLDVMATLGAAFLLGTLFERFRQSAVLGYVLAGVILAPGAAGLIRSPEAVESLAEVGIALLLFTVGLEFSFKRLRRMGRCDTAAVERNLAFSRANRINGTPAVFFEDGTRKPKRTKST